jgi:microcystin-dependent protein
MADPQSGNTGMNVPAIGSDTGTWGGSLNSNTNALDGMLGGVLALSLTAAATTTLSLPAGFTPTPSAGPVQSQNAVIKLTGTLSGNNVLVCTRPGFYIVYNNCTVGSFVVTMSNGAGSAIGLPPGVLQHVFNDGTNYYHCNLPLVGALQHMCVATTPGWITASTLPPFLGCDGSTYNISAYPNLGVTLGSTFGGNGATTFGVPDLRGRVPVMLNLGSGRVSTAVSGGLDGNTLGAGGGEGSHTLVTNEIPAHSHGVTDPTHTHPFTASLSAATFGSGGFTGGASPSAGNTSAASTGISIQNTGGGAAHNIIQPGQVTGIWLIRAA